METIAKPNEPEIKLREIYKATKSGSITYDEFCQKLKRYYVGGYKIDTSNKDLEKIADAFCSVMNVQKEVMFSKCKSAWIVRYRSFFYKIANDSGFGWTEIGRFCGLSHCNVLYNCNNLNDEIRRDKATANEFAGVLDLFNAEFERKKGRGYTNRKGE